MPSLFCYRFMVKDPLLHLTSTTFPDTLTVARSLQLSPPLCSLLHIVLTVPSLQQPMLNRGSVTQSTRSGFASPMQKSCAFRAARKIPDRVNFTFTSIVWYLKEDLKCMVITMVWFKVFSEPSATSNKLGGISRTVVHLVKTPPFFFCTCIGV